jgi:hypothetical protein
MAWTALENALAESITNGTMDRVEQMRREELIGLGRALYTFCESVMDRRTRNVETLATRLRAIAYHAAEIEPTFGKSPWRVVPEPVRKIVLRHKLYAALAEPLQQVFDGMPGQDAPNKSGGRSAAAGRIEVG